MCDITHSFVWHDSIIRVTWLIHTCDITHSCLWHDLRWRENLNTALLVCFHKSNSFLHLAWFIRTCDVTHPYAGHNSFIRVTWLIHTCDMTRSFTRQDSFTCVTWLIYSRHTTTHACMRHVTRRVDKSCLLCMYTHVIQYVLQWLLHIQLLSAPRHQCVLHDNAWASRVCTRVRIIFSKRPKFNYRKRTKEGSVARHDSVIRVTWLMHTCDMTHLFVWHASFICVTRDLSSTIERKSSKDGSVGRI